MKREDRLALIQMALGRASVEFMSNPLPGTEQIMPTAELQHIASTLCDLWDEDTAALERRVGELKQILLNALMTNTFIVPDRKIIIHHYGGTGDWHIDEVPYDGSLGDLIVVLKRIFKIDAEMPDGG